MGKSSSLGVGHEGCHSALNVTKKPHRANDSMRLVKKVLRYSVGSSASRIST